MARTLGAIRTLICLALAVAAIWFTVWKLQTAGDKPHLVYRDDATGREYPVPAPEQPHTILLNPAGRCNVDTTEEPDSCVTWMAPSDDDYLWRAYIGPRSARDKLPLWQPIPSPSGD